MLAIDDNTDIFRTTFLNSNFGMAIVAINGQYIAVNKQLSKLIGYTIEELLELNFDTITHPDDLKVDKEKVAMLLSGELDSYKLEKRYIHKCGKIVWVLIGVYLIRDENGNPLHLISQVIDRTESKEKEIEILETKNALQKIMDQSLDIICTMNLESVCLQINKASERVLGYSPGELIGTKMMDLVYSDDIYRTNLAASAVREGFPLNYFENRYVRKDGSLVALRWSLNANLVEEKVFCIVQDITELKQAEDKLTALNIEIETWAKELEISNSRLEEFAYVASHDLQEPLRMVTSFLQLLEKKAKDKLNDAETKYLHYAVDGAMRMQKMIIGLLDYSRVGQDNKTFEEVDLNTILDETNKSFRFALEKSGAMIVSDELPVITGDPIMLGQLFQNLLSNAIKYSRKDVAPFIEIKSTVSNDFYVISVSDNGIGMDPKYLTKIFTLFQRLHSKNEFNGSGIGLSICKRILEKHNGKIWAESEPGNGSTFYFSIPRNLS